MALDLTGGVHPKFAAVTGAGTTATLIQGEPGYSVAIFATGAVFVFNDVADGGTVAASTARKAYSAAQAASGIVHTLGGAVAGQSYATICVAAQASTVDIEVHSIPPAAVAP
jgi:hypothetical protein